MESKKVNPIFYKNAEEMNKPLSELMEQLRSDLSRIRGKLSDIRSSYRWGDRINHIEGGLTCMLVAMYSIMEEWKKFEEKKAMEIPGIDNPILFTVNTGFTCKGCGHVLPADFCLRTEGYCYMCDPNVTVEELLFR